MKPLQIFVLILCSLLLTISAPSIALENEGAASGPVVDNNGKKQIDFNPNQDFAEPTTFLEQFKSGIETIEARMEVFQEQKFALSKFELTQVEWEKVMGYNPSRTRGKFLPVENVSWDDAQEFIIRLNKMTGRNYRLPTEDEWNYACEANEKSKFCGGDDYDVVAWSYSNSQGHEQIVGQKHANKFGLYDMSGNVWEWLSDCEANCRKRALKGGSWMDGQLGFDQLIRKGLNPDYKHLSIGFRLARSI
jgi:formylglycine-generating enzyme required for sulfatase activity